MSYIAERRQEEKERRRAEILDAAEAVCAEVGWDDMTMDQVARKARLSRALLYVYFKDKQDLLFGLCERALCDARRSVSWKPWRARSAGSISWRPSAARTSRFRRNFPCISRWWRAARCSRPSPSVDSNEAAAMRSGDRAAALMVGGHRRPASRRLDPPGRRRAEVGIERAVGLHARRPADRCDESERACARRRDHSGISSTRRCVMATRSVEARH